MPYVAEHADALQKVDEKGAPVTFTKETPGTYDAETDEFVGPTQTTVQGHAVEIPGDPEMYEQLELILSQAITLLFVPTTIGQLPSVESTVIWAGKVFTVKEFVPIRPDGTAIAARVIVT